MTETAEDLFSGPGADAIYRQGLEAGEFNIQRCEECGSHVFYPRVLCPDCGSPRLGWVRASGRGTVYSTAVIRQRPERGPDYNIAIVELAEGPRMMSRVDGLAAEDVKIGLAVEARIAELDGNLAIVFDPVDGNLV